jgi:hypothetical protein
MEYLGQRVTLLLEGSLESVGVTVVDLGSLGAT